MRPNEPMSWDLGHNSSASAARDALAVFAAILLGTLGACSRADAPQARNTEPSGIGRFAVVPIAGKDHGSDHDYWYAWRINTETGELEFCTMDSGNLNPTVELHDTGGLSCTSPAR